MEITEPDVKCTDCQKQLHWSKSTWRNVRFSIARGHVFRCHHCGNVKAASTRALNKVPCLKPDVVCFVCGTQLDYPENRWKSVHRKIKKGVKIVCRSCACKQSHVDHPRNIGSANGFYGKKHSVETVARIILKNKAWASDPNNVAKHRRNTIIGMQGKGNKRHPYSIWVEKYGLEIAGTRLAEMSHKVSKSISGSGNPMYGKPSPHLCGTGIKGWYGALFFRSLLELRFIVHFDGIFSAESSVYRVNYQLFGVNRTYHPDFVKRSTGEIFEVKPSKLVNTITNKAKIDAAKLKFGPQFKIVTEKDLPPLNWENLKKLVDSGFVRLTERSLKIYSADLSETRRLSTSSTGSPTA